MDKHTLKANALAAMRAVIACEWAGVYMNLGQQKMDYNSPAREMYQNSCDLLSIEVDAQMKICYNSLKEYYENG
jgi:hypothetical protein